MLEFNPIPALIGGAILGISASLLMWTNGRVAGISGIVGGLFTRLGLDSAWRLAFAMGLLSGGLLMFWAQPGSVTYDIDRSIVQIAVAGLLVGFGTRLGNGCTSGHGVCGLSRMSPRSLASVLTFMTAGVATVAVMNGFSGVE